MQTSKNSPRKNSPRKTSPRKTSPRKISPRKKQKMILMFLEQLRGTNLSTQDRDKFWKKSKDEIERCFGSKLCRLEKHLVILKSERVTAAISKYRETMGFDETMTPVDVIMHVILQVNLQVFMVPPPHDQYQHYTGH